MIPVCAVLDVGRSNKKVLFFDGEYKVIFEEQASFPEIADADGDPCDDLQSAFGWLTETLARGLKGRDAQLRALNVATYGATLAHLDSGGQLLGPPLSYLKPIPDHFAAEYFHQASDLKLRTASPRLPGLLNAAVQLFWLQRERRDLFQKIACTLHLPQYFAWRFTGQKISEYSSLGCHTGLWDFHGMRYADPVRRQGWERLLPSPRSPEGRALSPSPEWARVWVRDGAGVAVGSGLHDSSSALIPYLKEVRGAFHLFSTGTWGVALNPLAPFILTEEDARKDCLYYLSYAGKPVRASRLFLGGEHDHQVARIAERFAVSHETVKATAWDRDLAQRRLQAGIKNPSQSLLPARMAGTGPLPDWNKEGKAWDLSGFLSYEEAYHQLLADLAVLSALSLRLLAKLPGRDGESGTKHAPLYVDGGFAGNDVFMRFLASISPWQPVYAAELPQSTALGAALLMHEFWQPGPRPSPPGFEFAKVDGDSRVGPLLASYAERYIRLAEGRS